jgi:hypothetical protein
MLFYGVFVGNVKMFWVKNIPPQRLPISRIIERLRISVPWVNAYQREKITELFSVLFAS